MGYLICKECNGYYELKEGESITDFESCECGGKFTYAKSLDDINKSYGTLKKSEICPSCGKRNLKESKYCENCGHSYKGNSLFHICFNHIFDICLFFHSYNVLLLCPITLPNIYYRWVLLPTIRVKTDIKI